MKRTILMLQMVLLVVGIATAQDSSVQNLYFRPALRKTIQFSDPDYDPKTGKAFYIYRNAVYRISTFRGGDWIVRIKDIRNDYIYYEAYGTMLGSIPVDSTRMHASEIATISQPRSDIKDIVNTVYLRNYTYVYTEDKQPKAFPKQFTKTDSIELVNFVSRQGRVQLYKQFNEVYYYKGQVAADSSSGRKLADPKHPRKLTRDVIWFTPSNARYINGLNIGIHSIGIGKDSIHITGVNLNADLLGGMFMMYSFFTPELRNGIKALEDTIDLRYASDRITGLSISGGGILGDGYMNGVSINGLNCFITVMNGFSIAGMNTRMSSFNGVAISGITNISARGRGVQIGLVNLCKDLRGVQFGLWNVNSKRKLPLVNWNFRKG